MQGDRAKEGPGRRSDHRHSANLLRERVESCVTLVACIVVAGVKLSGVRDDVVYWKTNRKINNDLQWLQNKWCDQGFNQSLNRGNTKHFCSST